MLVVPDPTWATKAVAAAAELTGALGPSAVAVDHIGSTAIPGMDAKPIVDLQVRVRDLALASREAAAQLQALGYRPSEVDGDHVPAGRSDDPEQWRKAFWTRRQGPGVDVNLHVRRDGSANARFALLFRDWFREHPSAVPAYIEFKRRAARFVPDSGEYSDLKDPVVDLVIAVAEPWAAATGWAPGG